MQIDQGAAAAVIIFLLTDVCLGVWNASKMWSRVDSVQKQTDKLETRQDRHNAVLAQLAAEKGIQL
jgi:hypothetical protein